MEGSMYYLIISVLAYAGGLNGGVTVNTEHITFNNKSACEAARLVFLQETSRWEYAKPVTLCVENTKEVYGSIPDEMKDK